MSQTGTLELTDYDSKNDTGEKVQQPPVIHRRLSQASKGAETYVQTEGDLPSPVPSNTVPEALKWNQSREVMLRVFATFYGLFLMGLNDGTYGTIIPYLEEYYHLEYSIVSLVFLTPYAGYTLASLSNNYVHEKLGQRGIGFLGPFSKIIAYAVISAHPPFPAVAAVMVFAGYGIGIEDAGWNAYISDMSHANQLLGFMHSSYGVGATITPSIATALITKAGWLWSSWFFVLLGTCFTELAFNLYAFWTQNGAVYRAAMQSSSENHGQEGESKSVLKRVLFHRPAARVTWTCAAFLFGYMGVEITLGGWIVSFMRNIRGGKPLQSGLSATGFWLGFTVGRLTLGFVTPYIGERLAISIYLAIAIGAQLVFWLVPSFVVSAVFVAFLGFFLGPMFPAAMVMTAKLLPKHQHVAVMGFAAAFGGSGGAVFPYIVGPVAQATSVKSLQPIVLGMLVAISAIWLCLPRLKKRGE